MLIRIHDALGPGEKVTFRAVQLLLFIGENETLERERNTTKFGQQFKMSVIEAVWEKAQAVSGSNPDKFRKDVCGAWMVRSSFGKDSQFGWEIDHIMPISKGGKDELQNLQPLHWKNNEAKADDYPQWVCFLKKN